MNDDIGRIEALVAELERDVPAGPRRLAQELLGAVLEFHRQGLQRMLAGHGAEDELVGSMLALHDLNPVPLQTRVEQALELVRPFLATHKGDVELLECSEGRVKLRLAGSCKGCPSSAMTLQETILQSLYALAPELTGVDVEGTAPLHEAPGPCIREIPILR